MRYVISGVLKQSRQAWSGSQLPQLIKHLVLARPAGRMEVISGGCLLGGQLTPVQGYFRKKKKWRSGSRSQQLAGHTLAARQPMTIIQGTNETSAPGNPVR